MIKIKLKMKKSILVGLIWVVPSISSIIVVSHKYAIDKNKEINFSKKINNIRFSISEGQAKQSILKESFFSKNMEDGFAFKSKKGNFYIGTHENGLWKWDGNKFVNISKLDVAKGFMFQDSKNNIYLSSYENGLFKLDEITNNLTSVDNDNEEEYFYTFMYQTKDGTIYVGTEEGLFKLKNNSLEKILGEGVGSMVQANDETIYVGTDNGFGKGKLKKLTSDKLIDFKDINISRGFIYKTTSGDIYIGTYNGLKKIVGNNLQSIDDQSYTDGFMYEIDNTIYIGSKNGLKKLSEDILQKLDGIDLSGGFMLKNGKTIYFGTSNGIKKMEINDASADNASIDEAYTALNNLNNTPSNLANRKNINPITLDIFTSPQKIGFDEPTIIKKKNVNVRYQVKSVNQKDGEITVTATISKWMGTIRTLDFTLIGYQSSSLLRSNIVFNEIKKAFSLSAISNIARGNVIASKNQETAQMAVNAIKNAASFDAYTNRRLNNIPNINDYAQFTPKFSGNSVIVTIRLPKSSLSSRLLTYTITGFKKQVDKDIELVKKAFDNLDNTSTTMPNGINIKPSLIDISEIKNIFNEPSLVRIKGVNVKYELKSQDDDLGKMTIEATISKADGTPQISEFTIKGFKSLRDKDKIQIANLASLKKAFKGGKVSKIAQNKKASKIALSIVDASSLKLYLGIDLTSLANTSQYQINATGNKNGKIIVSVKMITPGAEVEASKPLTINVLQHSDEVIDQKHAEDIKRMFANLKNIQHLVSNTKIDAAKGKNFTKGDLSIDIPMFSNGVEITYAHQEINANGVFPVTFTFSKGETIITQAVEVNFIGINLAKTDLQKAQDNKDVMDIKKALEKLDNSLTTLASRNLVLPSELQKLNDPSQLGFIPPQIIQDKNVQVIYKVSSFNDKQASLTISATITKGKSDKQIVKFTLFGYKNNQVKTNHKKHKKLPNKMSSTKLIGIISGVVVFMGLSISAIVIFFRKKS